MLFETDSWGPESLKGFCPTPYRPEDQNELFNRVGKQFNDAFGIARTTPQIAGFGIGFTDLLYKYVIAIIYICKYLYGQKI